VGKLRDWLHVHIFLCLLGPFLVLLHTSFKFGGLVAIAFWCMALVVASGVFGRWVYVWIPKTANGRFLGRREVRERLAVVLGELEDQMGMTSEQLLGLLEPRLEQVRAPANRFGKSDRRRRPLPGPDRRRHPRRRQGILGALADAILYSLGRRRQRTRIRSVLVASGIPAPARSRIERNLEEECRIEQQLRLLEPFQAAFRYWHAFHLPLALVMVAVLLVHVGVAIAFGYTWIWAS
jgi:hypothetical protein